MKNTEKWVAMWGNAMSITEHKPETYGKDITFRYPIYCPFNGSKIRVSFDNYCSGEDAVITRAGVFKGKEFHSLYFGGNESIKMDAGAGVTSDPLDIDIKAGETISVSFYFKDFTLLRSSVVATGPLSTGIFAVGDMTDVYDIPIEKFGKTKIFYFLNNVSVYTEDDRRALVCYGDSITAQDWPDYLKLKFAENSDESTYSVIRRAASGTRILRQYDNITYESYGLKGTNRFMHEVPTDGADTIIIQQGINDIIHPVGTDVNPFRPMSDLPTAEEMTDGLKWYISKARELGLRVYLGTLLPIEGWRTYADFREKLRCEVNEWIRNTDLADGVIDFDAVLRNPERQTAFLPEYDSGDHLHPSPKGYKKMAEEAYRVVTQ